jgi:hypothetical protein
MSWQNSYLLFKNNSPLVSLSANEKRQLSFDKFTVAGLPSRREEAWKYTSLSDFKNIEWKSSDQSGEFLTHEQMQEVSKILPSDFINYVFVNGILKMPFTNT